MTAWKQTCKHFAQTHSGGCPANTKHLYNICATPLHQQCTNIEFYNQAHCNQNNKNVKAGEKYGKSNSALLQSYKLPFDVENSVDEKITVTDTEKVLPYVVMEAERQQNTRCQL